MRIHAGNALVEQHDSDRPNTPRNPAPAVPSTSPVPPGAPAADGWSVRRASTTAGAALLAMSALAGFGYVFAVQGLVTSADPGQTGHDILASQGLFRIGIVSLVVVVALDVVVAWALYRVFSPVNQSLSMLAAALRLVYAGVFMVAIGHLLAALHLITGTGSPSAFTGEQLNVMAMREISTFNDIWSVGQLLFGLHLLVVGYLALRSGYVPRLIGALLLIAGLGYSADSLGTILSTGSWTNISTYTFLGEFLLALWLLIHARHIDNARLKPTASPAIKTP